MASEDAGADDGNFALFRDCVFTNLTDRESPKSKKTSRRRRNSSAVESDPSGQNDQSELIEFSDYLATEIFESLPDELKLLSHEAIDNDTAVSDKWSLPLSLSTLEELADSMPGTLEDSLIAYSLIEPPKSDVQSFISPIITAFVSAATTPPPKWIATKASACEICDRGWVPLTYHHLIPRQVHPKVLKRGWHEESQLNSVAWLCRACHSFVHKMASNEELARDWYTVDLICSREDVQKWAQWVGRIRWKKK